MSEPQPLPAQTLQHQIAYDLGVKAGQDACESIHRTIGLSDNRIVRFAAAIFAATHVLAVPASFMMLRRDMSSDQIVDALIAMIRPQLIEAIAKVRSDAAV